jgi:hypothetical protein
MEYLFSLEGGGERMGWQTRFFKSPNLQPGELVDMAKATGVPRDMQTTYHADDHILIAVSPSLPFDPSFESLERCLSRVLESFLGCVCITDSPILRQRQT